MCPTTSARSRSGVTMAGVVPLVSSRSTWDHLWHEWIESCGVFVPQKLDGAKLAGRFLIWRLCRMNHDIVDSYFLKQNFQPQGSVEVFLLQPILIKQNTSSPLKIKSRWHQQLSSRKNSESKLIHPSYLAVVLIEPCHISPNTLKNWINSTANDYSITLCFFTTHQSILSNPHPRSTDTYRHTIGTNNQRHPEIPHHKICYNDFPPSFLLILLLCSIFDRLDDGIPVGPSGSLKVPQIRSQNVKTWP